MFDPERRVQERVVLLRRTGLELACCCYWHAHFFLLLLDAEFVSERGLEKRRLMLSL